MSNDLDNQLTAILDKAEPWNPAQEEKPVEAEVKQNSEEEGVDNAAESSQEADKSEDTEGQTPSDEFEEELKNIDPELREALSKVDAEVKRAQLNAFKKMRSNFDKKQTEFGQEKKLAETAKQLFQKHGLDPVNGISQIEKLIHFEKELEKDPKRVVALLKQKFNLQEEHRSGSEELDESLLTDEEKLLYQKQKNIEKTVETLVEENRRLKELQERKEIEAARAEIERFKTSKNDDGSLKNPYFDDLIDEIGRLTSLYPNDNIESLYNKALRLNDEIYQKSLEDAKLKERTRILSEKERALSKAKSINSQSIKSSPKSMAQPTLDETLLAILERAEAQN